MCASSSPSIDACSISALYEKREVARRQFTRSSSLLLLVPQWKCEDEDEDDEYPYNEDID